MPSATPPAARAGDGVGRLAIMGRPVLLPARHARRLVIGKPALEGIIYISLLFNSPQSSPLIQVLRCRFYPVILGATARRLVFQSAAGRVRSGLKSASAASPCPFRYAVRFPPTSRGVGLIPNQLSTSLIKRTANRHAMTSSTHLAGRTAIMKKILLLASVRFVFRVTTPPDTTPPVPVPLQLKKGA